MSQNVSSSLLGVKARTKKVFKNARTKLFNCPIESKDGLDWDCDVYEGESPLVPELDPDYVFDPKELMMFLIGLERKDNLAFIGPTGTGKSTMPEQFCARTNRNCVRIGFDGGLQRADLMGEWIVKDGSVVYQYGIFPMAIQTPGTIIILDESDAISPEIAFSLHRPLEKQSRSLFLTETNECIPLAEDVIIVTTSNTNGMGDESGMYTGTRVQNAAFLNRFGLTFKKGYLPEDLEVKMLMKKYPEILKDEPNLIRNTVKFANAVRTAFIEGQVGMPVSTRDIINLLDLFPYLGGNNTVDILQYTITNRMNSEDAQAVEGMYQRAVLEDHKVETPKKGKK